MAPRVALQHYLRAVLKILVTHPDSMSERRIKQFLLGFALKFPDEKLDALHMRVHESERLCKEAYNKWVAAGEQVYTMRSGWYDFKDHLVRGNGLRETFDTLRDEPSMFNLPKKYRHPEEYARSSFAYAARYMFVTSPSAAEIFYLLQVFHHLLSVPVPRVRGLTKAINF